MILGIDATNLLDGGGLTHLKNFVRYANLDQFGFSEIVVFGSKKTLDTLEDFNWLRKVHNPVFEKNFFIRALWQYFCLGHEAKFYKCSILFIPGGSFSTSFRPIFTMSRNSLPFEWNQLKKYGLSLTFFRLLFLRRIQSKSFNKNHNLRTY